MTGGLVGPVNADSTSCTYVGGFNQPDTSHVTGTMMAIDPFKLGETLAASGYFKDVKSANQAVVKILAGQELGIGPIRAMSDVHVFEGKTALHYSLIGALIKRSRRYDYQVIEHNDTVCEIEFYEVSQAGRIVLGRSRFTWKDAERARLTAKDNWQKYPANMLLARAMSNGARAYCSEVFGGSIYTPEELTDGAVDVALPGAEPNDMTLAVLGNEVGPGMGGLVGGLVGGTGGTGSMVYQVEAQQRHAEWQRTDDKLAELLRLDPTASREGFEQWFSKKFGENYDDQAGISAQRSAQAHLDIWIAARRAPAKAATK